VFATQERKNDRLLVIRTIPIPQSSFNIQIHPLPSPNIQIHPLHNNIHVSKVHCGSTFEPGASRLHHYCTPLCAFLLYLARWLCGGKKKKRGGGELVKAKSSVKDPRATGGLVSNLFHPRLNKTKQHTLQKKTSFPCVGITKQNQNFP